MSEVTREIYNATGNSGVVCPPPSWWPEGYPCDMNAAYQAQLAAILISEVAALRKTMEQAK